MNTLTAQLGTPWEETSADGLVITPEVTRQGRFTGLWCVTHVHSGLPVGKPLPLTYARDLEVLLHRTGMDWTAGRETLAASTVGREAVSAAVDEVHAAMRDGTPALLARVSVWEAMPGVWGMRCCALDCGDGHPAHLDAEDDEPLRSPNRQDILDEARCSEWVRVISRYWMCFDCAAERRRASEAMQS